MPASIIIVVPVAMISTSFDPEIERKATQDYEIWRPGGEPDWAG
jgi:hypothetical protein